MGPYKEWLRSLGLFSPEKRRQRGDSVEVHNFLTRAAEGQLCSLHSVTSDRALRECLGLCQERFWLDVRERFFPRAWSGTETGSQGQWPWP